MFSSRLCFLVSILILASEAGAWFFGFSADSKFHSWPRDDAGISTVTYCYFDPQARKELKDWVSGGWKLWTDALGKIGTDHAFDFKEYAPKPGAKYGRFCFYIDPSKRPYPNTELPDGTVVIRYIEGEGQATVGYTEKQNNANFDRHAMELDPEHMNYDPTAFAHEIGHIMGFEHEHQRSDADGHVIFLCKNLQDYENVASKVPPGTSMDTICNSVNQAEKYNFFARAYAKYKPGDPFTGTKGPTFDTVSIMLYFSRAYMKPDHDPNDVKQVPIAKLVNGNPTLIEQNETPSPEDVNAVKKFYPVVPRKLVRGVRGNETALQLIAN